MAKDRARIYDEFNRLVNMSVPELHSWLATTESQSVGWNEYGRKAKPEGPPSIGYQSGLLITEILQKGKENLTDADYQHMKRVIAYIKRHIAQVPQKQAIETSRWRYSLMNWGHDPLKQL
jgi:hypothetical protein